MPVYDYIRQRLKEQTALLTILIDPGKTDGETLRRMAGHSRELGIDLFLVGGSLLSADMMDNTLSLLKQSGDTPVVIFPGGAQQLSARADALLFLSLLSGRNPEFLIGQQVVSAPLIHQMGLEALSTAYLLVESGRTTSVEFMSGSKPLPGHKPDIAVAHALAARYLGFKMIYLEAGSGAERPVPDMLISAVKKHIDIPLIVGGGLRSAADVQAKVKAGADIIVIGTHFEHNDPFDQILQFSQHTRSSK